MCAGSSLVMVRFCGVAVPYTVDPFGNPVNGTTGYPFGLAGMEFEPNSGNYYTTGRWYSPIDGAVDLGRPNGLRWRRHQSLRLRG